jgi:hypothetical protein
LLPSGAQRGLQQVGLGGLLGGQTQPMAQAQPPQQPPPYVPGAPQPQASQSGLAQFGAGLAQLGAGLFGAAPQPQPQMQQAAGTLITVQVPPGAGPGTLLQIQPPQGGAPIQVAVPAGLSPGQSFQVQLAAP